MRQMDYISAETLKKTDTILFLLCKGSQSQNSSTGYIEKGYYEFHAEQNLQDNVSIIICDPISYNFMQTTWQQEP